MSDKNEFGFRQISVIETKLNYEEDSICFRISSDCLLQYVNTYIEKATVYYNDNKSEFDLTERMSDYLSCFETGEPVPETLIFKADAEKRATIKEYKCVLITTPKAIGEKSSYDLQPGQYMIYPYGTNDYLAVEANNSASYKVFLYSFLGGTSQVWRVSLSSLNYSCSLKNMYNNLYMRWNLTDMDVVLDTGGIVGTIFSVHRTSDYYTIQPSYGNAIVQYAALSSYSNVNLVIPGNTVANNQKWTFIPVSQYGAAGNYRYTSSSSYRCYPYSLRLTSDLFVPLSTSYYTVSDVANAVCGDPALAANNLKARVLGSDMTYIAYVKTNEYRVAVRVGYHNVGGVYVRDYHFMEQLSDGSWAHKPSIYPSMNNISNAETDNWNLYGPNGSVLYGNFYDSDTIIIAVSPLA